MALALPLDTWRLVFWGQGRTTLADSLLILLQRKSGECTPSIILIDFIENSLINFSLFNVCIYTGL